MRVIAGLFRGRKLLPARATDIRPVTDRVKESIFNILQARLPLEAISVLDLFAGTGALGIEALSRGAAHATFVDRSAQSLKMLRFNIVALGCEARCLVIKADAMRFIEKTQDQFDLIFADPPYAYKLTAGIPHKIFSRELLKKKGFLIIEHSAATEFPDSPLCRRLVRKKFGQTNVSFFSHPDHL